MSIFPGNVLIIDDQFNICYNEAPTNSILRIQYDNFCLLKELFEENGIHFTVITETNDIGFIQKRINNYNNIRLLILDLDLNDTGEIDETNKATVKTIIHECIEKFGYFFLAINSSFSEKWDDIKSELNQELKEQLENDIENGGIDSHKINRKLNFINNFSTTFDKSRKDIQEKLLELLTKRFSNEVITQFECYLNNSRDKAFGHFIDFDLKTWDYLYHTLKSDMDSKEHINFTLNTILLGFIKQNLISSNYSVPEIDSNDTLDPLLNINIIRNFNYLLNNNKELDQHPLWTGNIYQDKKIKDEYIVIITPECDIAQSKGKGYTTLKAYEINETTFPIAYKQNDYEKEEDAPKIVRLMGRNKQGLWKKRSDIENSIKNMSGFYPLYYATETNKHLVIDFRDVNVTNKISSDNFILMARINEPIITDISDKFSAIYNRKGIPRLSNEKVKF